ncbi:MAG: glycerophosphodiester phosphodiesterase [Frankia sp.]|nr:glycerophosphodiester phosphodiesterase [Frankia sp.]
MIGFAHRGAPAWYQRENTLPAFARALAHGASLESDVWLTADGVPVLHHDPQLGRPLPVLPRRPLSSLTVDELPGWLPSLPALYQELGTGFELSLDIKTADQAASVTAAKAVVAAAREAGGQDAVRRLWLCGNLGNVARWREVDPDVHLVDSGSLAGVRAEGGIARYAARLRAAGVDALNLRAREWVAPVAPIVEVLHDHGLLAFGWDAQRMSTLRRLVRFGLDALYSDHVDRLVAVTSRG